MRSVEPSRVRCVLRIILEKRFVRSDMAKVLVERPRRDSRDRGKPRKGYQKKLYRQMNSDDGTPIQEGMRKHYLGCIRFNEHLGPLRRFLHSNVNRPWSKVQAEISAHINPNNVVQKHILTHLYDYVTEKPEFIDGVACYPANRFYWHGSKIEGKDSFYVCQKGFLRRGPETPSRWSRRYPVPRMKKSKLHWVNTTEFAYQKPNKKWEMVKVKPLNIKTVDWNHLRSVFDVHLNEQIFHSQLDRLNNYYGKLVYAVDSRVIHPSELKSLPIPIDVIRGQLKLPNIVR